MQTVEAARTTTFEVPVLAYLEDLRCRLAGLDDGKVATYIPELASADPSWFAIALATADGHVYEVGDTGQAFTIQSVSKPFTFGTALDDLGVDEVLDRVRVEPSGDAFNAIVFDDVSRRPFNPMVNAGAIVTSALVAGDNPSEQMRRLLESYGRFAGRSLTINERVFESERATGHRNRAIGHLMRAHDMLGDDVEGVLDLYFRQCSVEVTCRDLAVMGATLANRGVNPSTGERAIEEEHVAKVLSVMTTCGMYDYAGEWVYRIGMPAKSGVSGGVLAVLPGQFGVAVFSPPLDRQGNSVRGIAACEDLSRTFGLHLFTPHSSVRSAVRRSYRGDAVRSKRSRTAADERVLDREGHRVRVYELQGDLYFGSVDALTRAIASDLDGADFVVLDAGRVASVDSAAPRLLVDLSRRVTSAGPWLLWTGLTPGSALSDAVKRAGLDRARMTADVDTSLEWCENGLLERVGGVPSTGLVDLADQELVAGLGGDDLAALAAIARFEQYAAGSIVFHEGDAADAVYLVASGSVDVLLPIGGGRNRRLATVGAGVALGELAALDAAYRSATARAGAAASCYTLDREALLALFVARPQVAETLYRNLATMLSRRLRRANEEIRALAE